MTTSNRLAAPPIAERGVIVRGIRLATTMSDATPVQYARLPLVVLPAANVPWQAYRPILERFAPERRVFALDWPGFGASDVLPAESAATEATYAALLGDWLTSLGLARVLLLGNGIGATAALRAASALGGRVAGLVLVAPVGVAPAGRLRRAVGGVLRLPAVLRRVEPLLFSLALGPTTEATQALTSQRAATPPPQSALQTLSSLWQACERPGSDVATLARALPQPAIVVRGALDPVVTADESRAIATAIGPRGALEVVLPEAGHLPFLQQPERFTQVVAGLLATAEAAAPTG